MQIDKANILIIIFVFATILRQFTHLLHIGYKRNIKVGNPFYVGDRLVTLIMYIGYMAIWIGTTYFVFAYRMQVLTFAIGMIIFISGVL